MKYRDLIRLIEQDGWYRKRTKGSHEIYKHPQKKETVVIAYHGGREVPDGTLKSILKQAGLR